MGEFPSGQRGQTVNLLAMPSVVRIHLPPPDKELIRKGELFVISRKLRMELFIVLILVSTHTGQILVS